MERTLSREWEEQCIQEQPPACNSACPIHVNARGLIAAVAKSDFAAGYALFTRTVPFPQIVSRICDQPCRSACRRTEVDDGVEIRALEQACIEFRAAEPKKIMLPPRKAKRVAVVGGSLQGLTVAVDLAQKGYPVVVYEASGQLGGRIRRCDEKQLPSHLIEKDLSVLSLLDIAVIFYTTVSDQSALTCDTLLQQYDAVYIGADWQQCSDRVIAADPVTHATGQEKLYYSAENPESPIFMILQGRIAAISIDRFLQNASMSAGRDQLGSQETLLFTDLTGVAPQCAVPLADPHAGYARDEAVAEAKRCLQCQCLECVKKCEYLAHYGGYPKKYIREISNNDSIVMGIHFANKMINSCALCGQCRVVCPNGLDMGKVCLAARQKMVAKGKMPLSAHDFALRDMEFSTGDQCTLSRHQPGYDSSRYLFFPGCQLSASAPEHVLKTYGFLRQQLSGGVGLLLDCCGAPAEWAGRQVMFAQGLDRLDSILRQLGSPTVVVACATCYRIFRERWPDREIASLWTVLDGLELPETSGNKDIWQVCVHDPCAARAEKAVQDSVRSLLAKMGLQIEETGSDREVTSCCGYGGLMSFANPEITRKTVQRRINESAADYVAYCAMCRDNFAAGGKRTFHLLDLFWGDTDDTSAVRPSPDYSMRRENRIRLKKRLMREVWQEKAGEELSPLQIEISDSVRKLMEQRMILVDDVRQVINHAEASGEKMLNQETGRQIARFRPGCVTYWVEYTADESGFIVHNAYSHRMLVVEESGA
jgi:NADPH-dependent glutamate synthase beta subunit-like oxidoreductase